MPLSKALRHSKISALIALLLGCRLALPAFCAAGEDYTWKFNTSSANADVYGPFKLIYLQKGDSIDIIYGQDSETLQLIEDDIPADSVVQSLVLPTVFGYYSELLGQKAAAGSIPIYIGFTPQGNYSAAASYTFGNNNGPVYQALVNPTNPSPSDNFILFNSEVPLSLYDQPRAINLAGMADIFQTTLHEFTHSLGVGCVPDEAENGYRWSADNFNAYSGHLYDIFGTQAAPGQPIKIIDNPDAYTKSDGVFYLCAPDTLAENIKFITFHGDNVDELTQGEGIPILGALSLRANPEQYLQNGSSLSHNNSGVSYMNCGLINTTPMVTELDLAMLQDTGYDIDRSKYFGQSYLKYEEGQQASAVNEKNFASGSILAVGTHVYRNDLTLTQKGDITINPSDSQDFFSAMAGCGIMISGANNTINIPQGTTVAVSGVTGTGIGVNYGANNTLNIAGSVKANGYDGIGLLLTSGYENYYSEASYYSTHIADGTDPAYIESVKNNWADIYYNNAELKQIAEQAIEDNQGFSLKQLNITGTLEGERAAIYASGRNLIEEINVMGSGKILGDITSDGYMIPFNYAAYLKEECGVLPETRLTFGRQANADGTPDGNAVDHAYHGIFTGNMSNYAPYQDTHGILNYNVELLAGVLDLNKNNPENTVSVLSFSTSPDTVLNVQGFLSAETEKHSGYPRSENIGQLNIYGTLQPGGDGFGYVGMRGDSFNQGGNGKLKLDFDFSSGQHDAVGLKSWEDKNHNVDATFEVNLQNIEFVQKNSYEGAPVLLTREDFFPVISGGVIINDDQLAASVNNSATQFTELRDSWAIYDFSQGFTPYVSGEAKAVGKILDGRLSISELNQMSGDDWSLYRALMLPGYGGRLNDNARQLSGLSYAKQSEASMNVNHLLSGTVRNSVFDRHTHADDEWHWFAAPLAFTSRQQGAGGYSQHGSGILIGADKQTGGSDAGFFGGYLHDSASFRTGDGLRSKRNGGFIGAYFKQAKDRDNGPFTYGFVRYDNSKAKNRRALNINNAYLAEHQADFRQQGGAAELGAGWNNSCGAGTLTWSAGVNYALITQPAFRETGSGASAIGQTSENYQSLLGSAGVQYATIMKPLNEQTDYQVSIGARWQQELWCSDRNYNISLAGGSVPVHWESDADKGWLELTLQGQLLHKKKLQVTAAASTELFRKDHRGVTGSLKLEYSF